MLVAYDDRDIGFIVAHALEKMGHQVESMPYNKSALSRLREQDLRLAVLDVKAVDANGVSRLEALHEADPGLLVILAGGLGDCIGRAMQLGLQAWIDRPFRLEKARTAVKRVLDSQEAQG